MMFQTIKKHANKLYMGAGLAVFSTASLAIDTAAISTSIDAAEADALTTGEMVIGAVASLVVIGLIIGMVRKL